jgi:hypothetical protein
MGDRNTRSSRKWIHNPQAVTFSRSPLYFWHGDKGCERAFRLFCSIYGLWDRFYLGLSGTKENYLCMKILFLSDVPIQTPASGSEQVLYQQATGLAMKGNNVFTITRMNRNLKSIEFSHNDNMQDVCYSVNTSNSLSALFNILRNPPYLFNNFRNEIPFSLAISH